MSKSGTRFWKCWKSKFDKGSGSSRFIDGLTDGVRTAEAFAEHFRKTCTSFNDDQNTHLQSIYQNRRQNYVGDPFLDDYKFDIGVNSYWAQGLKPPTFMIMGLAYMTSPPLL